MIREHFGSSLVVYKRTTQDGKPLPPDEILLKLKDPGGRSTWVQMKKELFYKGRIFKEVVNKEVEAKEA
jgi:hypothetical protein